MAEKIAGPRPEVEGHAEAPPRLPRGSDALSDRQRLLAFAIVGAHHLGESLTNEDAAQLLGVSGRTIQNELAAIRLAGVELPNRAGRPKTTQPETTQPRNDSARKPRNHATETTQPLAGARETSNSSLQEEEETAGRLRAGEAEEVRKQLEQAIREASAEHGWDDSIHPDVLQALETRINAAREAGEPIRSPFWYVTTSTAGEPSAVETAGAKFHRAWQRSNGTLLADLSSEPFNLYRLTGEAERVAKMVCHDARHDQQAHDDDLGFEPSAFPTRLIESAWANAARCKLDGYDARAIEAIEQGCRVALAAEDFIKQIHGICTP